MDIFRIKGTVKDYEWGTTDYIPSLFGGYTGGKQAEYWMGTHPNGEAVTEGGEKLSSVTGYSLPFLFKVLSIASPLSLQCHPNKEQAEEGWKREEKLRESGAEHNYQDENEKAEMLSALTKVTALCGFRKFDEIKRTLENSIPSSWNEYLKDKKDIRELFFSFFGFEKKIKDEILCELEKTVKESSVPSAEDGFLTSYGIIRETLVKYPGDIGSVFPLMMNVIRLEPYDAVYLEPDVLHAYVKGNGIELMTASDNVLRGGLTTRHIDVDELGRIMYFGSSDISLIEKKNENGIVWYLTQSEDFSLGYITKRAETELENDSILLFLGAGTLKCGEKERKLYKGDTIFVPEKSGKITIEADSPVFVATDRK